MIELGTPSKIDHLWPKTDPRKFGAFITPVTVKSLTDRAIKSLVVVVVIYFQIVHFHYMWCIITKSLSYLYNLRDVQKGL